MKVDNNFIIEAAKEYFKLNKKLIQFDENFIYKQIDNYNNLTFGQLIHKIIYCDYNNQLKKEIIKIFGISEDELNIIKDMENYIYKLPSYQTFILIQPCANQTEYKIDRFYINEMLWKKNKSNYYYKLKEINDNMIEGTDEQKIREIKKYIHKNNQIPKLNTIHNHIPIRRIIDDIYFNNCYEHLKDQINEILKNAKDFNDYLEKI